MTLTIEISEDEIMEEVEKVVIEQITARIIDEYRNNSERYCYRNATKECVREAIKKDIDNLSGRAVAAAFASIENRAIKKLMAKMLEDKQCSESKN